MDKKTKNIKKIMILELVLLIFTPAFLFVQAFINNKQATLPTLIVVVITIFVFIMGYEKRNTSIVDTTCVVVMSVLAALLRLISPIPHAIFTTSVIIISAISFGESSGFVTGALAGLISNLFQGFGPWTPWQIYAWGIIGYIAGLLSRFKFFQSNIVVSIYGFISGFTFGFILNIYFVLSLSYDSVNKILMYFGASLALDFTHALSTMLFLILTLKPWTSVINRIRQKF